MNKLFYFIIFLFLNLLLPQSLFAFDKTNTATPEHFEMPKNFRTSLAMYGEPKYKDGFTAFDYVNVSAPDGGTLKQASFGSFDTFNPFSINGIAPAGIGLTHDSLMKQSDDEAFSLYPLIADKVALLADNKGVVFHINENATFNDASPITAEDVAFTFMLLKEKGLPTFRYYYQDVERVLVPEKQIVAFYFKKDVPNRELPFILAELPVLSMNWWAGRDFQKTSLDIPVSSGPFVISAFHPGRSITYTKNENYWAKNLPANKGYYHFDNFKYDYYRDTTVAMEAFKAGEFDVRQENEAKKWVQFQDDKNVINGRVKLRQFQHHLPSGMQGFIFNLRRPVFQDKRVREALGLAFDFSWMNQNLFYGLYQRTESFFDNSSLKAPKRPDNAELNLLKKHQITPPESFFEPLYEQETTKLRQRYIKALALLKEAGWTVNEAGVLEKEGHPFTFEILLDTASATAWERIVLPFIGNLRRIGIQATLRTVDLIQYKNRLDAFDYDMIVSVWGQSLSPGNEQRYFWTSQAADSQGSMNYSGLKNPIVDMLVEALIQAKNMQELETSAHALDRVLQQEKIVIPHWFTPQMRFMYKSDIAMPEQVPLKGANILLWWKI